MCDATQENKQPQSLTHKKEKGTEELQKWGRTMWPGDYMKGS